MSFGDTRRGLDISVSLTRTRERKPVSVCIAVQNMTIVLILATSCFPVDVSTSVREEGQWWMNNFQRALNGDEITKSTLKGILAEDDRDILVVTRLLKQRGYAISQKLEADLFKMFGVNKTVDFASSSCNSIDHDSFCCDDGCGGCEDPGRSLYSCPIGHTCGLGRCIPQGLFLCLDGPPIRRHISRRKKYLCAADESCGRGVCIPTGSILCGTSGTTVCNGIEGTTCCGVTAAEKESNATCVKANVECPSDRFPTTSYSMRPYTYEPKTSRSKKRKNAARRREWLVAQFGF